MAKIIKLDHTNAGSVTLDSLPRGTIFSKLGGFYIITERLDEDRTRAVCLESGIPCTFYESHNITDFKTNIIVTLSNVEVGL